MGKPNNEIPPLCTTEMCFSPAGAQDNGYENVLRLYHGKQVSHLIHGHNQRLGALSPGSSTQATTGIHHALQHQSAGLLRDVWRGAERHQSREADQGLAAYEKGRFDRVCQSRLEGLERWVVRERQGLAYTCSKERFTPRFFASLRMTLT